MKLLPVALAIGLSAGVAALPAAGAQAEIAYVSGGVGKSEQQALKAREKEFNLKLVFTLVTGNFVSNVRVAIQDAKGKTLIEHTTGGPLFMARLPAGSYSVNATFRGKTETRKVKTGERLHTEYWRWPSDPKFDLPLPPAHRAK
jgi:hypothetical protein